MQTDQALVDEIVFLGQLASDLSAINPLLDTLRGITATHDPSQPLVLNPTERTSLQNVRAQLEDHLLHKDSVRTFTKESLQQLLSEQLQTSSGNTTPLQSARAEFRNILMIVGAAYIISAVVFLALSVAYWWLLAASCTVTTVFISSCWLFLNGYKTFTPALQKAYKWICAGVILLGIGASSWMLFTSIPKVHAVPVLHYGLIYWLFGLAFAVAYIGLRVFAEAQHIQSTPASSTYTLLGTFILYTSILFLPHVRTSEDPYLRTTMIGVVTITYYGYLIALLARSIRKTLTPGYARAVKWFGWGYGLSATVGFAGAALILLTGTGFGIKLVIMGMFYATGGMLVFVSGYMFRLSSAGQAGVKKSAT